MSDTFDPYHEWLGIPKWDQPANAYRLLGIQVFEQDRKVIANAADRLMKHLRTYQTSKRSQLSQKLLNEVANAKICLLDKQSKAKYDAELAAQSHTQKNTLEDTVAPPPQMIKTPVAEEPAKIFGEITTDNRASRMHGQLRDKSAANKTSQRTLAVAGLITVAVVLLCMLLLFRGGKDAERNQQMIAQQNKAAREAQERADRQIEEAQEKAKKAEREKQIAEHEAKEEADRKAKEKPDAQNPNVAAIKALKQGPAERRPNLKQLQTYFKNLPQRERAQLKRLSREDFMRELRRRYNYDQIFQHLLPASPAGGRKGNKLAFPRGQWVDVLDRVDINKHAVEGHWTRRGQNIVVDQEITACRLMIPVMPEGDYDFELQFSPLSEIPNALWKQTVAIVPVGSASCLVWFHRDGWSGIDRINGRRPGDKANPTSVIINIKNNRRYSAVISVRHHLNQEATIRVSLDGKVLFTWNGPAAAVSLNPDWKRLWPSNTLGLGAFCTQTVFHSARLRVVSGEIPNPFLESSSHQ